MQGIEILRDYPLGDMVARYVTDAERKQVGLMLLPADLPLGKLYKKKEAVDSLVQVKLAGDIYNEAYALGNSMRNGESVRRLVLKEQPAGGALCEDLLYPEKYGERAACHGDV